MQGEEKMKGNLFSGRLFLLMALLLLNCGLCRADDAGLVLQLFGEITYTELHPFSREPQPLEEFMKIRAGDRIYLPEGARIEILLTSLNRREKWVGPLTIEVHNDGIRDINDKVTPQIEKLENRVSEAISSSNLPMPQARIERSGLQVMRSVSPPGGRAGFFGEDDTGIVVSQMVVKEQPKIIRPPAKKGQAEEKELEKIRSFYAEQKKKAGEGDILPEIYFLSELEKYEQYSEMSTVIKELLRHQPENPIFQKWRKWLSDNYPLRVAIYALTASPGASGVDGISINGVFYSRSLPQSVAEISQRTLPAGSILSFTVSNTGRQPRVLYLFKRTGADYEQIFPAGGEGLSLPALSLTDMEKEYGFALKLDDKGVNNIRILSTVSSHPPKSLRQKDRTRFPGEVIDISIMVH